MAKTNLPAKSQTPADALMETFREEMTQRVAPYLENLLPRPAVPRFIRMTQLAVARNMDLLNPEKASRKSLFLAVLWCAEKNLEPGVEDGAWLIPYKGKVTPVPAYKGLVAKAIELGAVTAIDAQGVYAEDDFYYSFGLDPELRHEPPKLGTGRGELIGVYAVATLPGGDKKFEVMDREEVEKVRNASAAWKSAPGKGPWQEWEDAMFKKTVIKRLLKLIPMKPEMRDLLADDGRLEAGTTVGALMREAGEEAVSEAAAEFEEPDAAQEEAQAQAQLDKAKAESAEFDGLVAKELAKIIGADRQKQLMQRLEENLKIASRNTRKTIPAFKATAAKYFYPYVNEKNEKKDGFWKSFMAWEAAPERDWYKPTPQTTAGAGESAPPPPPPLEPEPPQTSGEEEGGTQTEESDEAIQARIRAAKMKILSKLIPLPDLGILALEEITPLNIEQIEGKIEALTAPKKRGRPAGGS